MRKFLYLVVENEERPEREGGVSILNSRATPSEKNVQTVHHMRDMDTGERWTKTMVSLGHADFSDQEEYEEQIDDVVDEKFAEIDKRHLLDAGVDPEDVLDGGDA